MNFAPGDKLTPAQQARVDEVAAEALGIDASARQDLVRDRCGDEPAVARAVLALLAHAASVEEEGFLAGQAELPPLEPEATAALPDEEPPQEVVPEPATFLLFAAGLISLAVRRLRNRRAA